MAFNSRKQRKCIKNTQKIRNRPALAKENLVRALSFKSSLFGTSPTVVITNKRPLVKQIGQSLTPIDGFSACRGAEKCRLIVGGYQCKRGCARQSMVNF
jgi:hypothetical protein